MRVDTLGFYRFFAAIIIVVYHFRFVPPEYQIGLAFFSVFDGVHMVTFFFVVSGFVNYLAYAGGKQENVRLDVRRFVVSRCARILPLYWFSFFLSVVFLWLLGDPPDGVIAFLHFFLLQSWFPEYVHQLNFVSWTLSADLLFYALFPLMVFWMHHKKVSLAQVIVVNAIIFIATQVVLSNLLSDVDYQEGSSLAHDFMYKFPLFHLTSFMLGALSGLLVTRYQSYISLFKNKGIVYGVAIIICLMQVFGKNLSLALGWVIDTPSSYALLFAVALLIMSQAQGRLSHFLGLPIFQYLGNLSYSIYLFQIFVWLIYSSLIVNHLPEMSAVGHFFCGLGLLLLTAVIFYHVIEEPCYAWVRSRFSRKSSALINKPMS